MKPIKSKKGKLHKPLKRLRKKILRPFKILRESIRARTILLFAILLILFAIVFGAGVVVIIVEFRSADRAVSITNIQRFIKQIMYDAEAIRVNLFAFTYWDYSAYSLKDLAESPNGTSPMWDEWFESNFMVSDKNGDMQWHDDFDINLFTVYDTNFRYIFGRYYPPNFETGAISGIIEKPVPDWFKTVNVSMLLNGTRRYKGLLTPSLKQGESDFPTLIVSMEPVLDNSVGQDSIPYGWMLWGHEFRPLFQEVSDDVPICLSAWKLGDGKDTEIPTEVQALLSLTNLTEAPISGDLDFGGTVLTSDITLEEALKDPTRKCPHVPLFNNSESRVWQGIFRISDGFPGNSPGPIIRLDRQYEILRSVRVPAIIIFFGVLIVLIIVAIILIKFLDFTVLFRVDNLSKEILANPIQQPEKRDEEEEEKEEEEKDNTKDQEEIENEAAEVVHKESKTHNNTKYDEHYFSDSSTESTTSRTNSEAATTSTTQSSVTIQPNGQVRKAGNEIENLRNAVRANIRAAHSSMAQAKADLKEEGRKRSRHRDAMRLLNLWCGRKGNALPGLRENALADPRIQKTYTLDNILANPLGVEFLKAHCKTESSIENILFVLDVAWLNELETAEDTEKLPERKQPLHDAAVSAANAILARYITSGAQQEINLSSEMMTSLRNAKGYSRGMFSQASSQIKYVLSSDIAQRFKATPAFAALCEILDIENGSNVKPLDGTPEAATIDHRPSDADEHILETSENLIGNNFSSTVINKAFSQAFNRLRIRKMATPSNNLASPPSNTITSPATTSMQSPTNTLLS